jgi:hypothetical protein
MLAGDIQFDPRTRQITKRISPPHYMIYSPGVTSADIGMGARPPTSKFALPTVYSGYSGGQRTAYIIIWAAPNEGHGH